MLRYILILSFSTNLPPTQTSYPVSHYHNSLLGQSHSVPLQCNLCTWKWSKATWMFVHLILSSLMAQYINHKVFEFLQSHFGGNWWLRGPAFLLIFYFDCLLQPSVPHYKPQCSYIKLTMVKQILHSGNIQIAVQLWSHMNANNCTLFSFPGGKMLRKFIQVYLDHTWIINEHIPLMFSG
jgi:hypothetical protein